MNIDACVKKIDKYLKKDNMQPYIIDVQTIEELSSIVTHYNVGDNCFISLNRYCKKDELPRMDSFIDELSKKTGTIFITGLSTFLKLQGERVLKETLKNILSLSVKGHVVLITYQCEKYLHFLDKRLENRIYIFDTTEAVKPNCVFTSEKMFLPNDVVLFDGIDKIADAIEKCQDEKIYIKTKKRKSSFPNSLIPISDLNNPYSVLCMHESSISSIDETLGTDEQWATLLEKTKNGKGLIDIVDSEFGNHTSLDLAFNNYIYFDDSKKWLYLISLKLYGCKNNWVLHTSSAKAKSNKDFIKNIYRSILDIDPRDKNFKKYYIDRKNILTQLNNPIEEVSDYCKMVAIKGTKAIYYLTDNTQREKEMIITLLDKYGLDYPKEELMAILKMAYFDLYAYLTDFKFKNELLDKYFSAYKYQKVINKLFPDFLSLVLEQAEKREYGLVLSPRTSMTEKLTKENTQLYFIDALGVEFLGFIMSMCAELGIKANVKIGRCELPSITSKNKEFIELFENSNLPIISVKKLDEIKHHGTGDCDYQQTKLPLYIIKELEILRDIIIKINEKLINGSIKKAILISDHGASRLAVINESENIWEMAEKGKHSGRCCYKTEVDEQPISATDADDFWVLANYDRFRGSRKANVEVHGGATLEEVTIPIIELSKMSEKAEITIIDPIITVSYKKKATIKFFSKTAINDVSVCVDGMYFDAQEIEDNIFLVEMPQIKKAKDYSVDIYSDGNLIVEGLSFTVKKEGAQENSLL